MEQITPTPILAEPNWIDPASGMQMPAALGRRLLAERIIRDAGMAMCPPSRLAGWRTILNATAARALGGVAYGGAV